MHDIGDMLPPRGFAEPVMQREEIRLTYARPEDAAREMHKWGAGFASAATAGNDRQTTLAKMLINLSA